MATGSGQPLARVTQFFHSLGRSFYSTDTSTAFTWTIWDIENADIVLSDRDMRGANEVIDMCISLKPNTNYTVRVHTSTDGVEYALHIKTGATTTANNDVADFSRGGGGGV